MNEQRLEPRSIKEAHLYVELNPCPSCGHSERANRGSLSFEGNRAVKRHSWSCSSCGAQRSFTFVYPEDDAHLQVTEGYGPPGQPSTILDAGQFLEVSDFYAKRVPARPSGEEARKQAVRNMQEAIWAMEETLTFIGPGERDQPPPHALTSAASKRLLQAMPGQMQRFRLEARLGAYRKLLAELRGEPAPASAPAPATPKPAPQEAPASSSPPEAKARRDQLQDAMSQVGGSPSKARPEDGERRSGGALMLFVGLALLFVLILMQDLLPFYVFGRTRFSGGLRGEGFGYAIAGLGGALTLGGLFGVLRGITGKPIFNRVLGAFLGLFMLGIPAFFAGEYMYDVAVYESFTDTIHDYPRNPERYFQMAHRRYHDEEVRDEVWPNHLMGKASSILRKVDGSRDRYYKVELDKVIEDMEIFLEKAPESARADEIRAAIPSFELQFIKESGQGIPAYREFVQQYPGTPEEKEARDIIHAAYVEAYEGFQEQAADNPELVAFVKTLLDYLETQPDARLEMVFEPPSSEALAGITQEVEAELKEKYEPSIMERVKVAPVEPWFDREKSGPREDSIAAGFDAALGKVFPEEVLNLTRVRSPGAQGESPRVIVHYEVKPSDARFSRKQDPFRIYPGIIVDFDVTFRIPGEEEPMVLSFSVAPPESFNVSYEANSDGPSDGVIYATMAANAFANLQRELRDSFFRPESEASKSFNDAFGDDVLAPRIGAGATAAKAGDSEATPSPARPRIHPANPEVEGPLGKRIIRKVINRNKREARNCYERVLLKEPTIAGVITLRWSIDAGGRVAVVQTVSSELPSAVGRCLERVVKRWRFPSPKGKGSVRVTYPFRFSAGGADAPSPPDTTADAAPPESAWGAAPSDAPPTPTTTPTPTAAPSATLIMGAPTVTSGDCDAAVVRKAVEKRDFGLKRCYTKGSEADSSLQGGVVYHIAIGADGAVSRAKVKASTLGSSDVESCVVEKLEKIRFTGHGGACSVDYPFAYQ